MNPEKLIKPMSHTINDTTVDILKEMCAQGLIEEFIDPENDVSTVEMQFSEESVRCELRKKHSTSTGV